MVLCRYVIISINSYRYMNASSVMSQVNHVKHRPNLLVWYAADEPDGFSDPLDATLKSSNLITSLDGGDGNGGAGYHPISLVLNCENYYFTSVPSFLMILTSTDFFFTSHPKQLRQRHRHSNARYLYDRCQCHVLFCIRDNMY